MTLVLAQDKMRDIQSSHLLEKPRCCSRLSKKLQLTVSKAFAISTLRRADYMSNYWYN